MMTQNMQAFTVRPYRSEDVGNLVALFRDSVRQIALGDYTEAQLQAWAPDFIDLEQFGSRCASKSTWVAEASSEIAGFSDLESDGHVDMLYVHPRFKRRGVARALLAHIESIARSRGLDRLYTEASITARSAFEALGFTVLEARTVVTRGESMKNYGMEKRLVRSSS
jgi:putative acetyltransferase